MKTRISLIVLFCLLWSVRGLSQVGIGEREFTPNPSAIFEIQSTNKGILIPRLTYTQRMYIPTNAQSIGLLVYQTDKEAGFYYFDGLVWKQLTPNVTGGEIPNLAKVATSGSYEDLLNKPVIPTKLSQLEQDPQYFTTVSQAEREKWNAAAQGSTFSGRWEDIMGKPLFHSIATTGSYNDLLNKPAIPINLSDLQQDDGFMTVTRTERDKWNSITQGSSFTGNYNDLSNKPIIPTKLSELEQDQNYYTTVTRAERESWNSKSSFSGSYNDLQNKPVIPTKLSDLEQDANYYTTVSRAERELWNSAAQGNAFSGSYNDLKNKPEFSTVAFSGNYADLSNKPNIPQELTSLSKVAFSGLYSDLLQAPTVPTKLSELEQDQNYYTTVSRAERELWNSAAQSTFSGRWEDLIGKPDLKLVATTGNYEDLLNKPVIPTKLSQLEQDPQHFTTVSQAEREKWNNKSEFSGLYKDLLEAPKVPTKLSELEQDPQYFTTVTLAEREKWNAAAQGSTFTGRYEDLIGRPDLKLVATTGSYEDLLIKPIIPTKLSQLEQDPQYFTTVTQAEREKWNNKSDFSGLYKDLGGAPKVPTKLSELEQDPQYFTTVSQAEREKWNAAADNTKIPFSGRWEDLAGKPTFHFVATSGDYQELENKPELKPVAISGSYLDLTDKPVIPTQLSQLGDDMYNRLVSDTEKSLWNGKVSVDDLTVKLEWSNIKNKPQNFVYENDARLNDARIPRGEANNPTMTAGDLSGEYPSPKIKESVSLAGAPTLYQPVLVNQSNYAQMIASERLASMSMVNSLIEYVWESTPPKGIASGDLSGEYPEPKIKESVKLTGAPTATTVPVSSSGVYSYDAIKESDQIATLATVAKMIEHVVEKQINTRIDKLIPPGTIVMTTDESAVFDASEWIDVTAQFAGRFPIGYGYNVYPDENGSQVSYDINQTGGNNIHALTIEEMPAHTHNLKYQNEKVYGTSDGERKVLSGGVAGQLPDYILNTGGSKPHSIMPPYRVVKFYKKK